MLVWCSWNTWSCVHRDDENADDDGWSLRGRGGRRIPVSIRCCNIVSCPISFPRDARAMDSLACLVPEEEAAAAAEVASVVLMSYYVLFGW